MSRAQTSLAWPTRRIAVATSLAALFASRHAHASSMSDSFGVPNDPQPAPNQPPSGFPTQPGFPQQPADPPQGQPAYPQQPFAGTPQPQQPPQTQQPVGIQQFLVSTWQGQTRDADGTWNISVVFRPDSSFMQAMILDNGKFQLAMMGRFNARLGPDGGVLTLNPQQWNPRQVCANGACKPLQLASSINFRFKPLSRDQIQLEGGMLQRVGPPT